MKILHFEIENAKAIASWAHTPNGDHVEIAGDTGTGKTTAASALWEIMSKSPDCLKHGTKKGHILLKIGDGERTIIARRQFTEKTNKVYIESEDGESISIKDFKDMISSLSLNPHHITLMKPKEQVETLLKAADIGDIDLDELDAKIAEAEQERLLAYRQAEAAKVGEEPEKVQRTDVGELTRQLQEASKLERQVFDQKCELDRIFNAGDRAGRRIKEITDAIAALEAERKELKKEQSSRMEDYAKVQTCIAELEKQVATIDPHEVRKQLETVMETNDKAARYEAWQEAVLKYEQLKAEHKLKDEYAKQLVQTRSELLENAKWPLDGLSIEDGCVTYNGVLVENLGESEQILVCCALAIKDILAHPLHVVRLDGVESMSKRDFDKMQQMFGDSDIQVISTRVARGDTDENEIVITEKEDSDGMSD